VNTLTLPSSCSQCDPADPPASSGTPVVIGLDTSLTATGVASSRGWSELVGYTDRKNPITKLSHLQRLAAMLDLAARITLAVGRPDLVVLEAPSLASKGGGGHERGWLWWEVYRRLTSREIPIALLAPSQRMLYATGKGAASKAAVVDAVARRWPDWTTNGDDNLADAVVLMAAGLDHLGHPLAELPKAHRAALDKATWPTAVTR
jgi:crossover junction endodeoxyribonuclease RuvC